MPRQNPIHPKTFPPGMQNFIIVFMRAVKAGRLYSTGHTLFKQSVKHVQDQLQEARGDRDLLFMGFARDSLLLSDEFFPAVDTLSRDFLDLFHSLGISHLVIHKEATDQELESFVETLSGAKAGQGQEVLAALQRENIKRIDLGLLDYSVFTGLESAVNHFIQGNEEAAIWRQLIFLPAMAGAFHLDADQIKEILRLSEEPETLRQLLAEFDRNLKSQVQNLSSAQRGKIIGNFLQNISKAVARIDAGKRGLFNNHVAHILTTIRPDMRISILGAVLPECVEGEDGGVVRDLIEKMPEQELIHLLTDALSQGGAQSPAFNNLLGMALARFKSAGPLLNLVRSEMKSATQEHRPDGLNLWQHLEQLLIHHQESEDFNAQYRKAIEDLASSIRIQKAMVEEEEIARLVRTLAPDSLKLFKARLIVDLLLEPEKNASTRLALIHTMGETIRHFLSEGRPRLTGNLLRQVFLSVGRFSQKDSLTEEINTWLSVEDVHNLLKHLLEKCRTYEPREMSAIGSICQLYPEKAGSFLIDRYLELGDRERALEDWISTTLASLAPRPTRLIESRMTGSPDAALPRLIGLADLLVDQRIAPTLERLLDHKDYGIRSQTVRTLGRLKSAGSVEPLAQVVLGRSWFAGKKTKALKMEALKALAAIQTEDAKTVLEQIASTGSGDLRKASQELLEKS
jgi:hypothetical protein